ncbi:hypothetical protein CDAR_477081 [Caerostris darwini]|uniref:Uncharacterized protein n=1 Tax=Caerostris darwini TaxID=1538125 RepID=A0AAV4V4M3_9ARAC|nr:hypothetical protein CDAR_477081 [Caerostris darwini]
MPRVPQGHEREGGGVVSRVRRQGVGASLRRAQLRRVQGLLQAQRASQPGVRVQGAGALRGGRRTQEPVSGLQAEEVPRSLHEKRR